jgi:hypothetical protein
VDLERIACRGEGRQILAQMETLTSVISVDVLFGQDTIHLNDLVLLHYVQAPQAFAWRIVSSSSFPLPNQ